MASGFWPRIVGDLGGLQALDADQQRDLAVRGRELRERALERELGLRVGERLERRALVAGGVARAAGRRRAARGPPARGPS